MIIEINVDMDGVLSNFDKRAMEIAGFQPKLNTIDKKLRNDFWKAIGTHVRKGGKFFEEMEWMPDGRQLWDFLATYHIPKYICTATGHVANAMEEKRPWVRKHIGVDYANLARVVRTSNMKAEYAGPGKLLIDDRNKSVDPWREAGGIAILHKDTARTIAEFKELMQ